MFAVALEKEELEKNFSTNVCRYNEGERERV
jgi:hypothetical protein